MAESARLRINEIFTSLQGEGTRVGVRCVFVRLTGCHLRCTWCDTTHAFFEGHWMTLDEILTEIRRYGCPTIEVTGGEPLLQPATGPLLTRLADEFETVLLETSGAVAIDQVDPRVVRIVDIKCPGSGEVERNHWPNIAFLKPTDEVKFVLADRDDYEWAKEIIAKHDLNSRCPVLLAPVHDRLPPADLAKWVLADRLNVRVGLQLQKLIWPAVERGV